MEAALLWILAIALMLVGLAGTLAPVLPGIPLLLLGMVIAAWIDDFRRVGATTLVILAVVTALSFVIEAVAASLGAKRVGASRQAILGAAIGTAFGMLLGLVGLVVGPFVGAMVGELAARSSAQRAMHVGLASWIGFAIGAVAKLALAFTMLGIFVAAWLIPWG